MNITDMMNKIERESKIMRSRPLYIKRSRKTHRLARALKKFSIGHRIFSMNFGSNNKTFLSVDFTGLFVTINIDLYYKNKSSILSFVKWTLKDVPEDLIAKNTGSSKVSGIKDVCKIVSGILDDTSPYSACEIITRSVKE